MDLTAFIGKLLEEQDGGVLLEGIRVLAQALIETEVAGLIGAERHERTSKRTAYRNGSRLRTWETRMGTIELAIPKIRPGTYFPSLLEPRRRAEHALLAVRRRLDQPRLRRTLTRLPEPTQHPLTLKGATSQLELRGRSHARASESCE